MALGTLTELQLAVMNALWSMSEGTLADVHGALRDEDQALARTTVATMLQRLSKQRWVAHRRDGRRFLYRAAVARDDAASGALQRLVRGFFGGSVAALTAELLVSNEITEDELERMRELVKDEAP